jgi:hypothetical protein
MKRFAERWHWLLALGVGCAEPYESLPSDVAARRGDAGGSLDGGFLGRDARVEPDADGDEGGRPLTIPDAGTSADTGSTPPVDPAYCTGWTYCDTFEGTGNIPWRSESDGPLAMTEVSALRAKSGKFALRGYRTQATTNWAEIVFKDASIQQCEYDVFVPDSPGAASADVGVAYASLNGAPPYTFRPEPFQIYFDANGIKLWEYHYGLNAVAPTFVRQPVRDVWHHMAVELTLGNTGAIGSKASLAASAQAPESRQLTFSETSYTTINFGVGLTNEQNGIADIEVYIDNVRCK